MLSLFNSSSIPRFAPCPSFGSTLSLSIFFTNNEKKLIQNFIFTESNQNFGLKSDNTSTELELISPEIEVVTPITPTTPITPSDDSDERTGGPVSLSDSCADSYSESLGSLEDPSPPYFFQEKL